MDIYCHRCGEPYDIEELHDTPDALTFDAAQRLFRAEGCGVTFGNSECEATGSMRAQAAGVLSDLLGDDVDGMAALLEDFEYAGMLDD